MSRSFLILLLVLFLQIRLYSQCGPNEVQIVVSIQTDNFPLETSWQLVDQNGTGFYISPGDLNLTNSLYVDTFCVPDTNCYSFKIYDTYGDGICCSSGSGFYNVTYAGITVASGGSFGSSETTFDIGNCTSPPPSCPANEQEMVITLTTDSFPLETSFTLVDQNGNFLYSPSLTLPNHTYSWTLCVPDTNCYQFTVYDSYGDGFCCVYGNGSYTVTYSGDTVASGASFLSSETTSGIGYCPPVLNCNIGETEIIITVSTDDYPTETSWFLMDQFGGGWTNVPLTTNDANTTFTWTLCVPDTHCYTFTMLDSYGDGICCGWGNGSYNVTYDGVSVASGGAFGYSYEHCGIGLCVSNCQITIPSGVIPEGEPCGVDANHGCDDHWSISNFTITGVTDIWAFGGVTVPIPFTNNYWDIGDTPDLYVYMRKNNQFFYYSDYYLDTWYANSFTTSGNLYDDVTLNPVNAQPLSFSMYANNNTPDLEVPTYGLYTSPYVSGQNFNYDFLVGDDDAGSFLNVFGANDFIGSYVLPSFTTAGTFSVLTSGGTDGNAYVDYTTVSPTVLHTSLTNGNIVHGSFWSENNVRDTDWYEFIVNGSVDFSLSSISETPYNVILMEANGGCGNTNIIDSVFAYACDSVNIQQTLPAGTYWLLTFPTSYSCVSCNDSIDYLLDVAWQYSAPIYGCTDTAALNFDPLANTDDGSCTYPVILGCTDPSAFNYNPAANVDDGSCIPVFYGCTDPLALNYYPGANIDDGSCIYAGCTDSLALNYDPSAVFDDGSCVYVVYGCMDSTAFNYDPLANTSDSSCIAVLLGCTDSLASNYDMLANTDNGSCLYDGCTDTSAINYDVNANNDDGSCIYAGCTDLGADNYDPNAIIDNGSCIYLGCTDTLANNYDSVANVDDGSCFYLIYGCLDSLALNFDSLANTDDGSCIYPAVLGCTDSTALNFDPLANTDDSSCVYPVILGCTDSTAFNYNPNATVDDESCIPVFYGCTDPLAINYYPGANTDDGSCLYPGCTNVLAYNYDSTANVDDGSCVYAGCTDTLALNYDSNTTIDDGSCVYCSYGCTDPAAFNYDSLATCDDGSCIAILYGCTDPAADNYFAGANTEDGSCIYAGCTDPGACNYDPTANADDGSCEYTSCAGCTDPAADNYDANATVDDGSCTYPTACNKPTPTGQYVDEIIHNRVRVHWDNMTDAICLPKQYRIQYREVGTTAWSQKNAQDAGLCNFGLPTTSKRLTNLTPSTTYEYRIKAWYCNTTGASIWSSIDTFTTAPVCPNVGNFAVSTPLTTRAVFTWDDSNGPYSFVRIKFRIDSIQNPTGSDWQSAGGFGVFYPTFTRNKNGLTPGETYRGQSRTWCDPSGGMYKSLSWTPLIFWTQPTVVRMEGGQSITNLDIYPNPSRDIFNISFTSEEKQDLQLRVLNVVGEEILLDDMQQFIGEYVRSIDLNKDSKGIYLLEIITDKGIINKKLVLQ